MHAFKTLIDAQKRQVYDRIQKKQKPKMEPKAKAKTSKARPRPDERPEEDVKVMGRESA